MVIRSGYRRNLYIWPSWPLTRLACFLRSLLHRIKVPGTRALISTRNGDQPGFCDRLRRDGHKRSTPGSKSRSIPPKVICVRRFASCDDALASWLDTVLGLCNWSAGMLVARTVGTLLIARNRGLERGKNSKRQLQRLKRWGYESFSLISTLG